MRRAACFETSISISITQLAIDLEKFSAGDVGSCMGEQLSSSENVVDAGVLLGGFPLSKEVTKLGCAWRL